MSFVLLASCQLLDCPAFSAVRRSLVVRRTMRSKVRRRLRKMEDFGLILPAIYSPGFHKVLAEYPTVARHAGLCGYFRLYIYRPLIRPADVFVQP